MYLKKTYERYLTITNERYRQICFIIIKIESIIKLLLEIIMFDLKFCIYINNTNCASISFVNIPINIYVNLFIPNKFTY